KLLKLNDFSIGRSTASAFIQARSKIKVNAFNILFDQSNKKHISINYENVIGLLLLIEVNCPLIIFISL
uniref:hypothetical protein n=1 Tax=Thomasclavelia spiroformis TaxID=29348 RepID=UPI00294251E5